MTSDLEKFKLNIVMGAATFGEEGRPTVRIHDLDEIGALLDIFRLHGHTDVDTAYFYTGGTSEVVLGKIDRKSKGLKLETKLPAIFDIKSHLLKSLEALDTEQLEIFYLHTPDRSTPYEVTMEAINALHREGYFRKFGISNYTSWEVAELVGICRANGYVVPSVYQGLYNAVHRAVEPELIPCLRKFGISFYAFNPLGGGFFTGRYSSSEDDVGEGTRFDPSAVQGKLYRDRYWNKHYFEATSAIRAIGDANELSMAEIALRWLCHHSVLKREFGDSVLIGASSLKHVKQNLVDLEKGPLPENVIEALDKGWETVRPYASSYYH
ncbi:Aldo/keto reductase [Lentinula novae-zelandiae]|nr:Aldo/keto reductase [Lentinula novae-zelandiae]